MSCPSQQLQSDWLAYSCFVQITCFGGSQQVSLCSPTSHGTGEDEVAYLPDSDVAGPQFQLQALLTKEKFDGIAVNQQHPQHVATFVAPVSLRNLLPHPLVVDVVTPNSTQPQVCLFHPSTRNVDLITSLAFTTHTASRNCVA